MSLPGAPFVAYRSDRLFIDGCDATELARRFGTPLYVYSRGAMRAALEPYGPPIDFLPFVSLRLSFNEGVSFSLLAFDGEAARLLLIGLTAALTLGLIAWVYRSQGWQRAGLALAAAGALGNLIDRAVAGHVVDFVDVYWGTAHFWAFNVADAAITVGAVCVLLDMIGLGRQHASHSV